MPSMQLPRIADLNVNYKVQEILEANGFVNGKYKVYDAYPNDADLQTNNIWPTVSIEIKSVFGRDVELGSDQWPGMQIIFDVFANTDSQRDDVSYILWKALNEVNFTLYDFSLGVFPSAVGNYTGITTLGDWEIGSMSIVSLNPPPETKIVGEKHHSMLDGILYLPNI